MKKTWFITGASRGFGRIWAEAALERGDRVTATARKLADVSDLAERFGDAVLPLALDVTDSAQVEQAVHQAYAHFGRLDVLVNNAGASLFAATEEASDEQIRGLFDANYFGMVRVLRAAMPLLRKRAIETIGAVLQGSSRPFRLRQPLMHCRLPLVESLRGNSLPLAACAIRKEDLVAVKTGLYSVSSAKRRSELAKCRASLAERVIRPPDFFASAKTDGSMTISSVS